MVYLLRQVWLEIASPRNVTTYPGQLSDAITEPMFGVGTSPGQLTFRLAGQVMVGFSVSLMVTVNEQEAKPQLLVAVIVTVVVPILKKVPLASPLPLPVVAPVNVYVSAGTGIPVTVGL